MTTKTEWNAGRYAGVLMVSTALAAALLLGSATAYGADGTDPKAPPAKPVKVESIAGASVKRVTLTAKAAERLGIATGRVTEEPLVRKLMVGGEVMTALQAAQVAGSGALADAAKLMMVTPVAVAVAVATAPATEEGRGTWVRVALSERELGRVAQDRSARVLPLSSREGAEASVMAQPSKLPPTTEAARASSSLFYLVEGTKHWLPPGQRVRVELPLAGSGARHKVVPYGAVLYDAKGRSWVYTNPEPLVFVRQKIEIQNIEGDQAALSSGPAVGTAIVTVGAMMLYGAETQGK